MILVVPTCELSYRPLGKEDDPGVSSAYPLFGGSNLKDSWVEGGNPDKNAGRVKPILSSEVEAGLSSCSTPKTYGLL